METSAHRAVPGVAATAKKQRIFECRNHHRGALNPSPKNTLRSSLSHPKTSSKWNAAPYITSRRTQQRVYANASSSSFPFEDYHSVGLRLIQGQEHRMNGFIMFQKLDDGGNIEDPDEALLLSVGGDTLSALISLLRGAPETRPLAVELLWRVLQRGNSLAEQDWSILHVAITGLSGFTFLGRIYFGDPQTGHIAWDVDCRPSDATWLATKCGAPIYVHRAVWDSVAAPLDEIQAQIVQIMAKSSPFSSYPGGGGGEEDKDVGGGGGGGGPLRRVDVATIMKTVAKSDPEPLKLLKMELRVALSEENYSVAAQIRDHPFMKLHLAAATAREEGDVEAARKYERQLLFDISKIEINGGGGSGSVL